MLLFSLKTKQPLLFLFDHISSQTQISLVGTAKTHPEFALWKPIQRKNKPKPNFLCLLSNELDWQVLTFVLAELA